MDTHSLLDSASEAIARLDVALNAHIAGARNDRDLDHWLRAKHRIKQSLSTKHDADLAPAALDALAQIDPTVQR